MNIEPQTLFTAQTVFLLATIALLFALYLFRDLLREKPSKNKRK